MRLALVPLCALLLTAGCNHPAADALSARPEWNDQLRAIAADYKTWTRVSDSANFAPQLCDTPPLVGAQKSDAAPGTPHSQKLYYLFAKHESDYPFLEYEGWWDSHGAQAKEATSRKQPIGQVVVKQSFKALSATKADFDAARAAMDHIDRTSTPPNFAVEYLANGVRRYAKIGDAAGLFVMLKVAGPTNASPTAAAPPDTDQGWVYATISPAGDITSAGRVASCMDCHKSARYDRLFGPKGYGYQPKPQPAAAPSR